MTRPFPSRSSSDCQSWKGPLHRLAYRRQAVGLRAYAHNAPLNEYKREAFPLFQQMLVRLRVQITAILDRVEIRAVEPPAELFARPSVPMHESRGEEIEAASDSDAAQGLLPARSEERRVGKEWVRTCRSGWPPCH